MSFIHSLRILLPINSTASSSPLLLRGAPYYSIDAVSELTHQSATGSCVSEGLTKGPTWWLEWDSNLRLSRRKAPNLPLSHHSPALLCDDKSSVVLYWFCKVCLHAFAAQGNPQFCITFEFTGQTLVLDWLP